MYFRTLLFLLILISGRLYANVIQYFTGINYSNPAELFKVKENSFILGETTRFIHGVFVGSAINASTSQVENGESTTNTAAILGYGRVAHRYNDKVVVGVDVTQPFFVKLEWGNNAFTRFVSTETHITDYDISPRISLNPIPKFYMGAGINFNYLQNVETNFALPTSPNSSANLINPSSNFGIGYDAGVFFVLDENNFLSLAYYSHIDQATKGTSTFNGKINPNYTFNVVMPATTLISYVHLATPWRFAGQLIYSEWSRYQEANFRDTAASVVNITIPLEFSNSLAYGILVGYDLNEQWSPAIKAFVDTGPERDKNRVLSYPTAAQYFAAISTEYHLNKTTTFELSYGHGYVNTFLKRRNINGDITINADVVDFKVKIDL